MKEQLSEIKVEVRTLNRILDEKIENLHQRNYEIRQFEKQSASLRESAEDYRDQFEEASIQIQGLLAERKQMID